MEYTHTKDRLKTIITNCNCNGTKKWRERYGNKDLQRI